VTAVSALARGARSTFVPQCGLVLVSSASRRRLIRHFDTLRSVRLRVGAWPSIRQRTQVFPHLVGEV